MLGFTIASSRFDLGVVNGSQRDFLSGAAKQKFPLGIFLTIEIRPQMPLGKPINVSCNRGHDGVHETQRDPSSEAPYITVGTRVRFRYFRAGFANLAGIQLKLGATEIVREGVIEKMLGDHPTMPTRVKICAREDNGDLHEFEIESIFAVIET